MWMACAYFFFLWQILIMPQPLAPQPEAIVAQAEEAPKEEAAPLNLPVVDPGNTEVEAGTSLLVTASFTEHPDSAPTLRLSPGTAVERTFAMGSALEDPVFAVRLPAIEADTTYHIAHPDGVTEDFTITTYTHPTLLLANATVGLRNTRAFLSRSWRMSARSPSMSAAKSPLLSFSTNPWPRDHPIQPRPF